MGKPTGFLDYVRELPIDRSAVQRIRDWNEFHEHMDDAKLGRGATFLSLDVEGAEAHVLEQLGTKTFDLVLVEITGGSAHAARIDALAAWMPKRMVAGPETPSPSVRPLALASRARHRVPPPSTPRKSVSVIAPVYRGSRAIQCATFP